MTSPATERVWHRLSPRMLLVHPVHEVLRQIPLLVGAVVLGSATGNSWWTVAALAVTIAFGVLRWFTTTYRIEPDEVQLRTGVLQRKVVSVPRNRIRSVQTDARLLHQLLGLTVLRVSTGQQATGDTEFALDAVRAEEVPRLRSILLADSLAHADETGEQQQSPGRLLARWHPSWLRYSPLSFTGLAMILAAVGVIYQAGLGAVLEHSRLAESGRDAAQRFGVVASVAAVIAVVVFASVALSVLRSLLTFGNLALRRDADVLHLRARSAAQARAHLRHAQAARRHPAPAAAGATARRRAVGRGDDGRRGCGGGLPSAAAVPGGYGRIRADRADLRRQRGIRSGAGARCGRDAQAMDAWTRVARCRRGRLGRRIGVRRGARDGRGSWWPRLRCAVRCWPPTGCGRSGTGWTSGGWWQGRAAWSVAATASPRRASSDGPCARRSSSEGRGWRRWSRRPRQG